MGDDPDLERLDLVDGALQLDDVPDGAAALLGEHLGEEAAALRQLAAPPR